MDASSLNLLGERYDKNLKNDMNFYGMIKKHLLVSGWNGEGEFN